VSTIPRLMSRKRSKVNADVLDAQSAQPRTRPFGRGLLDANPPAGDKKRCRIYRGAKGSGVLCGEQRVPNNIVLRTRARRLPSDKRAGPSLRKAQPGLLPRWPAFAAAGRKAVSTA
jgi:hypothetical protein